MENKDDLYSNILTDGPSPSTLFLILSRMKKSGQLKEVIQECLRALTIYPNDIYIRRLLAETYFEEGQISQAEAELDKVIARINDLISCYGLQARIFLQQGRESEALAALKLYLSHRPDDQTALNLFNQLQTTLTRFKEEEGLPEDRRKEFMRRKKEKMISILESWLFTLREGSKAGLNDNINL